MGGAIESKQEAALLLLMHEERATSAVDTVQLRRGEQSATSAAQLRVEIGELKAQVSECITLTRVGGALVDDSERDLTSRSIPLRHHHS